MPRSLGDINTVPCTHCGKVIRYKADVARHNLLHDTNKSELMYTCSFPGCTYKNLQKSNVATHFRTHTGEKPKSCPDCSYTTSDPGSLTRHRKRIHGYQPKQCTLTKARTKRSKRHSPYSWDSSAVSSISCSSSPNASEELLNFQPSNQFPAAPPVQLQLPSVDDASCVSSDCLSTFTWENDGLDLLCLDAEASATCPPYESLFPVSPERMPHHLFPANEAGHALERGKADVDANCMGPYAGLSWFPFDLFMSASAENLVPTTTCRPTDTYTNPPLATCGFQEPEIGFMEQLNNELPPPSYMLSAEPQASQFKGLSEVTQNAGVEIHVDYWNSNVGDLSLTSSPPPSLYSTPPSSPESTFFNTFNSPFSSPASSVPSSANSPSSLSELCFDSLLLDPPIDFLTESSFSHLT